MPSSFLHTVSTPYTTYTYQLIKVCVLTKQREMEDDKVLEPLIARGHSEMVLLQL